jgi:hypothetical protein
MRLCFRNIEIPVARDLDCAPGWATCHDRLILHAHAPSVAFALPSLPVVVPQKPVITCLSAFPAQSRGVHIGISNCSAGPLYCSDSDPSESHI